MFASDDHVTSDAAYFVSSDILILISSDGFELKPLVFDFVASDDS